MGLTSRARDLAMIAAACVVSACAAGPGAAPVAASSATPTVPAPAGTATAGSATATVGPAAGGGTATVGPAAGSPSPTGPPTAGAVIPTGPLTQADNGETFLLTVGQQITVVLATPRMWDRPTAQGSAVTSVSASGGYPGTAPARAVFRAVVPGTAQVTSSTDMPCEHGIPPCPAPEELWGVSVVVIEPTD